MLTKTAWIAGMTETTWKEKSKDPKARLPGWGWVALSKPTPVSY